MSKKERLDRLLVERGLAESAAQAQRLIMAGEVSVEGSVQTKPGQRFAGDVTIEVREPARFVSRGGGKLAAALDDFKLDVRGMTAIDVGASTGGFTDCLLQRGVARVYAVDVGYGLLAWKLRTDPRVTVLERTNIRHLASLPDQALADLAVIDASFISLALVLPATLPLLQPNAQIIALVKPQFEANSAQVEEGGVVRNPAVHRQVIQTVGALAADLGWYVAGLTVSPLPGPAGNREFLLWLRRTPSPGFELDEATERLLLTIAKTKPPSLPIPD
jgi:23S rRNA (cytidine1920-2'-O)/16S rRNA (cytidine1409-2'-O)-methyltransferase